MCHEPEDHYRNGPVPRTAQGEKNNRLLIPGVKSQDGHSRVCLLWNSWVYFHAEVSDLSLMVHKRCVKCSPNITTNLQRCSRRRDTLTANTHTKSLLFSFAYDGSVFIRSAGQQNFIEWCYCRPRTIQSSDTPMPRRLKNQTNNHGEKKYLWENSNQEDIPRSL